MNSRKAKRYYSNGKLLLTGEYMVLYGAKALAFPTVYGQDLTVEHTEGKGIIKWEAFAQSKPWINVVVSIPELEIVDCNDIDKARFLVQILSEAFNEGKLPVDEKGYKITTNTNFPVNWGLGTSSTLINNVARMVHADPFQLAFKVSNGSGYDIACANRNTPIIYRKTSEGKIEVQEVGFNKNFSNHLFFIYSGRKKSTQKHVADFVKENKDLQQETEAITAITEEIIRTDNLSEFINCLRKHEEIVGRVIGLPCAQEEHFKDFKGVVKSLGAWGGDFLLAVSPESNNYTKEYFEQYGLSTIIPFKKMILH